MIRAIVVLAAGALASAQTFRSSADVVVVTASVTRDGRPVAGLTAADFRVTDNGAAQDVSLIQVDRIPIDVTVVLGAGASAAIDPALSSANGFRAKLNSTDRLRVISAGETVVEMEPMTSVSHAPEYRKSGTAGNSFNDALFYAMAWPTEPARRHLVISYFISLDDWSSIDGSMLPKLARRTDAAVYVVATPPDNIALGNRQRGWERDTAHLIRTARQTGGALVPLSRATKAFDQILEEFRASYVLQFVPPAGSSPGWHALDVKVPGTRGITVRARQGYER